MDWQPLYKWWTILWESGWLKKKNGRKTLSGLQFEWHLTWAFLAASHSRSGKTGPSGDPVCLPVENRTGRTQSLKYLQKRHKDKRNKAEYHITLMLLGKFFFFLNLTVALFSKLYNVTKWLILPRGRGNHWPAETHKNRGYSSQQAQFCD